MQAAFPEDVRTPATLDSAVILLLMERLKDEYTAHYFYRNAANWCKDKAYNKAAAYFEAEAASELTHAEKLQNYLVDWNVLPVIAPIKSIPNYTNLIDIINKAYDMELGLLISYNENSQTIFPICLSTIDFLQKLRKIQTESVAEYSDLLNAAQLINVSNPFEVLYFENEYFEQG